MNSLKDALKDTARNSLKTTSLLTDPYTIPLLGKLTGCTYQGFELTLLKTLYYNGCIISNKLLMFFLKILFMFTVTV